MYKPFGRWHLDVLVNDHGATLTSLTQYHQWVTDRLMYDALSSASQHSKCSIEQAVVVMDAAGLTWAWGLNSMDGVR